MYKYSTLIFSILFILGTILSLIELYASSDGLQYPISSSLYYLTTSLIMIFVFFKFNQQLVKKVFLINNLIIILFTIHGVILALICLYALEPDNRVESLASSIFFFSSMIASASIFFVKSKVEESVKSSNKYEETNNLP